jgi:hypothetical protein
VGCTAAVGEGAALVGTAGEGGAAVLAGTAAVGDTGANAVGRTVGTNSDDGVDVGDGVQAATRRAASATMINAATSLFNDFSLRIVGRDIGPKGMPKVRSSWTPKPPSPLSTRGVL